MLQQLTSEALFVLEAAQGVSGTQELFLCCQYALGVEERVLGPVG
jgi:hypothetical protein